MTRGRVKTRIDDRKFGFIAQDGGGDVFVHVSELGGLDSLLPGQRVEFLKQVDEDGRARALDVRVIA
jgi:CspA family cold shock protein